MADPDNTKPTVEFSKNVIETITLVFGLLVLYVAKQYLIPSKGDMNLLFVGIFGVIACIVLVSMAAVDPYVFKNITLGIGIATGMILGR